MIIVKNNIIPFKGYKAMTVWPFIFVRKGHEMDDDDLRHEEIHGRQQLEMLLVLFPLWYYTEWLVRLVQYGKSEAYDNISFEREAYANEKDKDYMSKRKLWAWTAYL